MNVLRGASQRLRVANWRHSAICILQFAICILQLLPAPCEAKPTPSAVVTNPSSPAERVVYDLSRFRSFDDERLPAALIAAAVIALVVIVWYLYRRDTIELPRARASSSCFCV